MSAPRRQVSTASRLPVLLMVAGMIGATFLWLQLTSALATTGSHIYRLNQRRAGLLAKRSELLLAYARATDPHRLEQRARQLGFAPAEKERRLLIYLPPDAPPRLSTGVTGPLDLVRRPPAGHQPGLLGLVAGTARPVAAQEQLPAAVGGAR